jgi:hypothetical protein
VYGKIDAMRPLATEDAAMFGKTGIDEVLQFKAQWLSEPVNYSVDAIHEIDLVNRVVVVGFDCLIPGKEGRGSDVIQFDKDGRVCRVGAIRHAAVAD